MTNFKKEQFDFNGTSSEVWVTYNGEFIGRFKYRAPKRNAKDFVKFLTENFTVEEYFEKVEATAPVRVLEEKGYVDYNTRQAVKKDPNILDRLPSGVTERMKNYAV